jgi:hypothetical protein
VEQDLTTVADPIKLFFFSFPIFAVLSVCYTKEKKIIENKKIYFVIEEKKVL